VVGADEIGVRVGTTVGSMETVGAIVGTIVNEGLIVGTSETGDFVGDGSTTTGDLVGSGSSTGVGVGFFDGFLVC